MLRSLIPLLLWLSFTPSAVARDVRIGVLGIFHPRVLVLTATNKEAVVIHTPEKNIVLEPWSRPGVQLRVSRNALLLSYRGQTWRVSELHARGRNGAAVGFVLAIPGKITRTYRGALQVRIADGAVAPVITMDLETAVASVVHAESYAQTPLEALKAQAVVTRSYFVAGAGRHAGFDFCDLTHCQFLREPPGPSSPFEAATKATRGLVLSYAQEIFAAMFTRSCAGKTRTPADLGMPGKGYPYFAVVCRSCYANPLRWTRQLSHEAAAQLLGNGEAGRLAVVRELGWDAVPSNNYTSQVQEGRVTITGTGQGHGLGLCQRGAQAMARDGAAFREILQHYFHNTRVTSLTDPTL